MSSRKKREPSAPFYALQAAPDRTVGELERCVIQQSLTQLHANHFAKNNVRPSLTRRQSLIASFLMLGNRSDLSWGRDLKRL